ncbi:MAG: hydrogenase maturation nickel metallochaperone HypA [Candidatus Bathyarchaeota archaeon]|nr:hydrogenase maturation nickel metallochaperone HypA [Candidatus Bathyarchaeota archaeon]
MHELAMATQIVENVLEEAKRHDAKKVAEVHLTIGKMSFLGVDQIKFSYGILVKDTILEDSKLIVEEKDGKIECNNCGYKGTIEIKDDPAYHIPVPTLQCPKCGQTAKIVEGKECTITSIRILKQEDKNGCKQC